MNRHTPSISGSDDLAWAERGSPEASLDPMLPIIDCHHHLWEFPRTAVASIDISAHPFEAVGVLSPRYMFEELLADTDRGHNIVATVFVECRAMYRQSGPDELRSLGQTEFVNGVAAMSASGTYGPGQICAGIVGHVDLQWGAAAGPVLEKHVAAAGDRFKGVRNIGAHDADPRVLGRLAGAPSGLYADEGFRQGFSRLAPLGLSFDAWILEPQLPDVIDLARAFPETQIILDHVGTPLGIASYDGRLPERFGLWRENIRRLAKSSNVAVKLGGLGMPFCGFPAEAGRPASEVLANTWRPYIETCIEAFGAERCMFESNFPVDRVHCDYVTLWNAFKRVAADATAAEKTSLFSGTAARVYRLDEALAVLPN